MKGSNIKSRLGRCAAIAVAVASLAMAPTDASAVTVTVTPAQPWVGYMNVFELPANGGGYVFGSNWGVADLRANFTGPNLTIEAAPIGTGDAFWYQNGTGGSGAAGNKQMDANFYLEDNTLAGQEVTFTGTVLSNSLVAPYTSVAFVKDFAPDYSSVVVQTVPLAPGTFSVTLQTINDPARHVQYGIGTVGPNVWPTDVGSKGAVVLTAVPEPAMLASVAALGGIALRRRRK